MTHELKLNKRFFSAVADGRKTFEIRKDDRSHTYIMAMDNMDWQDHMLSWL